MAAADDVVALVAAQEVVTKWVLDDVVAFTAEYLVGLHAGVQVVIATITPERVDTLVAN